MKLNEVSMYDAIKWGKIGAKVSGAVQKTKNAASAVKGKWQELTTRTVPKGMRVYGTVVDWKQYLLSNFKYVTFTRQKGGDTIEARYGKTVVGYYTKSTGKGYVINKRLKVNV